MSSPQETKQPSTAEGASALKTVPNAATIEDAKERQAALHLRQKEVAAAEVAVKERTQQLEAELQSVRCAINAGDKKFTEAYLAEIDKAKMKAHRLYRKIGDFVRNCLKQLPFLSSGRDDGIERVEDGLKRAIRVTETIEELRQKETDICKARVAQLDSGEREREIEECERALEKRNLALETTLNNFIDKTKSDIAALEQQKSEVSKRSEQLSKEKAEFAAEEQKALSDFFYATFWQHVRKKERRERFERLEAVEKTMGTWMETCLNWEQPPEHLTGPQFEFSRLLPPFSKGEQSGRRPLATAAEMDRLGRVLCGSGWGDDQLSHAVKSFMKPGKRSIDNLLDDVTAAATAKKPKAKKARSVDDCQDDMDVDREDTKRKSM